MHEFGNRVVPDKREKVKEKEQEKETLEQFKSKELEYEFFE